MPLANFEINNLSRTMSRIAESATLGLLGRTMSQYESILRLPMVELLESQRQLFDFTAHPAFNEVLDFDVARIANLTALSERWLESSEANIAAMSRVSDQLTKFFSHSPVAPLGVTAGFEKTLAGISPSLLNDVARSFEFVNPFADLLASLDVILEHLEEAEGAATATHPLADPNYRARQAIVQASVVLSFLLAGAVVQPPRTVQDLPSYLMAVWTLVVFVGWVMGDD